MKLHTDILTREDLYAALPTNVALDVMQCGSRSRARGFTVSLEYVGPMRLHLRPRNHGCAGADPTSKAASWDEWGIWLDRLFAIDPAAKLGPYNGREDFLAITRREVERQAALPDRWKQPYRSAPWLSGAAV